MKWLSCGEPKLNLLTHANGAIWKDQLNLLFEFLFP